MAGRCLPFLGDVPYRQGNLAEARKLYEEAILFIREIHEIDLLAYALRRFGYLTLHEKDYGEAVELFGESLESNRQVNHLQGMVACLAGFASLNLATKSFEKAALLCGCVENLLHRTGIPLLMADSVEYNRCVSQLRETLDEKTLSVAWSEGRDMTLEQAIELALQT